MKPVRLLLALVAIVGSTGLLPVAAAAAETAATPPKPKQFLYVLKLIPRLHDDKAWTDADGAILGRHFNHLKAATERGQVVFAGRTDESGADTFGLVVFEAADADTAREFMNSDPAVAEGVMTATLHPFVLALRSRP